MSKNISIEGVPEGFYEFLKLCDGIPIDNIDHCFMESYLSADKIKIQNELFGNLSDADAVINTSEQNNEFVREKGIYIGRFDYLVDKYDLCFPETRISKFIKEKNSISFTWLDSINYAKVMEAIKDYEALRKQSNLQVGEQKLINARLNYLRRLLDIHDKKVTIFEGNVITPDLTITLFGDLIQAVITASGKVMVLYGNLDKDKKLNNIEVAVYNVFDFAYDSDYQYFHPGANPENFSYQPYINCENIVKRIKELEMQNINPEVKLSINFAQFLNENGLGNMYDRPISALYFAKSIFIDELLKETEPKR